MDDNFKLIYIETFKWDRAQGPDHFVTPSVRISSSFNIKISICELTREFQDRNGTIDTIVIGIHVPSYNFNSIVALIN